MRVLRLILGMVDFIAIVFAVLMAYQYLIGPLNINEPTVKQQVERPLPQWDKRWQ